MLERRWKLQELDDLAKSHTCLRKEHPWTYKWDRASITLGDSVVKLTLMWHMSTNSSNRGSGLYQSSKQTRTYQGSMCEYDVRDVTAFKHFNNSYTVWMMPCRFVFTAIRLYSCIAEMLQHGREVLCFPRFQHSAVSGAWQMGWDSS